MAELAHDEAFCTSCGEVIKEAAEICPECGTRQKPASSGGNQSISDMRKHELEKIASKDKTVVLLLGFFLSPIGYVMIGKLGYAALNFFTLNYLLLGPILVPIHCYKIMEDAKDELRMAGVEGY